MNNRGQLRDVVDISVAEGEYRETTFEKYMKDKYDVDLLKKSKYKHYDYDVKDEKIFKIELKTVNATLDTYTNVFLGLDKICYYLYRFSKNPHLRFFIVYGFYDINEKDNTQKIIYKYDEIDIHKYLSYPKKLLMNKHHKCVPVSSLKSISGLVKTLK